MDSQVPTAGVPSFSEIRDRTQLVFGRRPCLWQIKVVEAILRHDRDVASIAGMGMKKTLTFWMPLLFTLWNLQSRKLIPHFTPLNNVN